MKTLLNAENYPKKISFRVL